MALSSWHQRVKARLISFQGKQILLKKFLKMGLAFRCR
jgi:hypothetical protein